VFFRHRWGIRGNLNAIWRVLLPTALYILVPCSRSSHLIMSRFPSRSFCSPLSASTGGMQAAIAFLFISRSRRTPKRVSGSTIDSFTDTRSPPVIPVALNPLIDLNLGPRRHGNVSNPSALSRRWTSARSRLPFLGCAQLRVDRRGRESTRLEDRAVFFLRLCKTAEDD
jgi:hypothetical protein